jgi:hypothetical protein
MATNYKQGFFKPKNPDKYRGDPTNIVYRSGWEKRVMAWLDENKNVLSWSSEEVIVPYISPIDGKVHRYFVDFYVEAIDKNAQIKTMLLEVKPAAQAKEPVKKKRTTKQYVTEVMTYGINQAKWHAAKRYAEKQGWEFKVITEAELFGKKTNK